MNATKPESGLYGTDTEVFAVTPAGVVVLVASPDRDEPLVISSLPAEATALDPAMVGEDCNGYWSAAAEATGETID
jgi:hypothetical protein